MELCELCRKITFTSQTSPDSTDFVAILHPSLDALRNSAMKGYCSLCIVLDGIIRHRKLVDTSEELLESGRNHIELSFSYLKTGGDWVGVDGEEEIEEDETTDTLVFIHPFGGDSFKILNPDALDRRRWMTRQGKAVSAADLDCGRSIISCRSGQPDESTGSNTALELAASWIEHCKQNHPTCQRELVTGAEIPKRLLDVSGATGPQGRAFLVSFSDTAKSNHKIQYATLSHRWDPKHQCTTTTHNHEAHINIGLAISELPKTFGEACITCNNLGVQYLWIDSLCIVQDSSDDKLHEISKMGEYYQNAEFNISASTEMTNGGLWRERDGRATRPLEIPVTVNVPSPSCQSVRIDLKIAPYLRGSKSHLDYRGWILQERIFARRTLFFDPYWISFQCAQASASENCPAGVEIGIGSGPTELANDMGVEVYRDCSLGIMGGTLRDVASGSISASGAEQHRRSLYKLWYRIIHEYTPRRLTFESDRLLAVAGLAKTLSRVLNDEYIAGMWRSDLLIGLQWRGSTSNALAGYRSRTSPRQAPTWSWASIDLSAPLNLTRLGLPQGIPIDLPADTASDMPLATVVDVQWACRDVNVLKDVARTRLVLRGRPLQGLLRLTTDKPDLAASHPTMPDGDLEEVPKARGHPPLAYIKNATYWYVYICGTTSGGERGWTIMDACIDVASDSVEGEVHILPLFQRWVSWFHEMFCLILREATGGGTFERIGWAKSIPKLMPKAKQRDLVLV